MNNLKKIAIVAGDTPKPRLLALFDILRSRFQVTLYVLGHDRFGIGFETGMKCKVFPTIDDMPGYMRDIESELSGMDAIIALETSKLSTFQAIRTARKYSIPAGVVSTECQPNFYEKFPNIRAIQFDVCHHAVHFWPTSQEAWNTLLMEGVPAHAMSMVRPVVSTTKFKLDHSLRHKFRSYVGLGMEDFIIVCRTDLEPHARLFSVLDALHVLRQRATPACLRVKLLFVGDGSIARELKLKAADQGLGAHVMFLHQDPEPFLCDMLNAADFYLVASGRSVHKPEEFPLETLEAMRCGVIPIVPAGSVAADVCGSMGYSYAADQPSSLVGTLFRALNECSDLALLKSSYSEYIEHKWQSFRLQEVFLEQVCQHLAKENTSGSQDTSPSEILRRISSHISQSRELDALILIEETELRGLGNKSQEAKLSCLKGKALYQLGRMTEAMDAYTKSMQLDDQNPACLQGLGFIAWHGHSNEEALTFFKKALALDEEDASSAYGIGLVYRRLGLLDEAFYWLERSILCGKASTSAITALAQTCAQLSPYSKGIAALERLVDSVGEHQAFLATLGQLYLADGRIAEGKDLLEKALRRHHEPAS